MSNNKRSGPDIVREVCERWPEMTRDEMRRVLAPDCVYVNMPMPHLRCVGPDQAYDFLSAFGARWRISVEIPHMRGDDEAVLVERAERFESRSGDGRVVELLSMGIFELRDGQITHWRDYFDSRATQALVGG